MLNWFIWFMGIDVASVEESGEGGHSSEDFILTWALSSTVNSLSSRNSGISTVKV
jgi:hypothetical protein